MLTGVAASSGIARGPAFVVPTAGGVLVPRRSITSSELDQEPARFLTAVAEVGEELLSVRESTRRKLGDDAAAIFEAQMWLLHDPALQDATIRRCRQERINIEAALSDTVEKLSRDFAKIGDAMIRERAADLRDIALRLLRRLLSVHAETDQYPADAIIVTEELLPSLAAALDKKFIRGIIAERGGLTAHAVILARALGIPTLLYVEAATRKIKMGDPLLVDGLAGRAFIRPSPAVQREYERHEADLAAHRDFLKGALDLPATTRDGTAITLRANIGKVADAVAAAAVNAAGIGLYRTEFVFLVEDHFPTEEEQYQIYRKTAECLPNSEMVIRVLDVGSDKSLSYFPLPTEPNPSLGQRGTRLLLSHPEILEPQLRAILRLSATSSVAILFPMIGGVGEIVEAKSRLESVKRQFLAEKIAFNPDLRVGAMIETPSAAITARYIAQEVDFLSVGTNDLTQYLLASDRSSREMTNYYEPLHPAVMLSLKAVLEAAAAEGKEVSVCGEMAGNPAYTELLLGLGLRSLSVVPGEILEIKRVIRSVTMSRAHQLAQAVLAARTIREVKDCLAAFIPVAAVASVPRLLDAKTITLRAADRWENEGGHVLISAVPNRS
jgi:phosphotransferase system enzyme I (PtsI)